jgi:hypothetical protein
MANYLKATIDKAITEKILKLFLIILLAFVLGGLIISVSDKASHIAVDSGFLQLPTAIATPLIAIISPVITAFILFYLNKQKETQVKQYDRMYSIAKEKHGVCLKVLSKLRKPKSIVLSEEDVAEIIELIIEADIYETVEYRMKDHPNNQGIKNDRIGALEYVFFYNPELIGNIITDLRHQLSIIIKMSERHYFEGNLKKAIKSLEIVLQGSSETDYAIRQDITNHKYLMDNGLSRDRTLG